MRPRSPPASTDKHRSAEARCQCCECKRLNVRGGEGATAMGMVAIQSTHLEQWNTQYCNLFARLRMCVVVNRAMVWRVVVDQAPTCRRRCTYTSEEPQHGRDILLLKPPALMMAPSAALDRVADAS